MENNIPQNADGKPVTPDQNHAPVVTNESLEAIQAKLANDMRAQFGRLKQEFNEAIKAIKPEPVVAPSAPAAVANPEKTGGDVVAQQVRELQEKVRDAEARANRIKTTAIRNTLHESLVSGGADPDLARAVIADIVERHGKSIKAQEDDLGGYQIGIDDGMEVKPIKDWATSYLQTDLGKKIVPPKRNPDVRLPFGGGSGGDRIRVTRAEANNLDPKILKSGRVELID
jgi:hypothetical protein